MFFKTTIENHTTFKSYSEFLEKVNEMGAVLHFEPPHITFRPESNLTKQMFVNFLNSHLKTGTPIGAFTNLNFEYGIYEFFKIFDKYNNTNYSNINFLEIGNLQKHCDKGLRGFREVVLIPEGYSHTFNTILKMDVDVYNLKLINK